MNTEERFWRKYRAYWILLIALGLIALWAYLTMPRMHLGGDGESAGISGGASGSGTGSADGGDGTGAGNGGESSGAGSGENPAPPEAKNSRAESAPKQSPEIGSDAERSDGTAGRGDAAAQELPKVSLVQPLEEVVPAAPKVEAPSGGKTSGRRGFYGIDVKKDGKVLFLVDVSGSMASPSTEFPGKTKLDVLKDELVKSICGGSMNPNPNTYRRNGGFVIMRFSDQAYGYPEKGVCRYRNTGDVKKALEHVSGLGIEGGTFMIPGWEAALERVAEDNIDTIYFLTDGEPSDNFNESFLTEYFKKHHFKKSLTIHCIAIGCDQNFMKKIAADYKGKYVYLP